MEKTLLILKAVSLIIMGYQLYKYTKTKKTDDLLWAVLFASLMN